MSTLKELCGKYKNGDWPDKDSVHSYVDMYEKILAPYRDTAQNILEIGLMNGESLRMWSEYFSGKVYGMDCSETPINGLADLRPIISQGKHNVIIADATSEIEVEKYFKDIKFDIVVEDAQHNIEQQVEIFNVFKKYMNNGGLYCIEDIENIDKSRWIFESISIHKTEIIDRRNVKGRFDDVLVLIHF